MVDWGNIQQWWGLMMGWYFFRKGRVRVGVPSGEDGR